MTNTTDFVEQLQGICDLDTLADYAEKTLISEHQGDPSELYIQAANGDECLIDHAQDRYNQIYDELGNALLKRGWTYDEYEAVYRPNLRSLRWGYLLLKNSPHSPLYDNATASWGCRAINANGFMDIIGNRTAYQGCPKALGTLDLKVVREAVEARLKRSWERYDDLGVVLDNDHITILTQKSYGYIHTTVLIKDQEESKK